MRRWACSLDEDEAVAPPWTWINENVYVADTETGRPVRFKVWPWFARVLWDIFPFEPVRGEKGKWRWVRRRLPFDLCIYSGPKKSGKTALNAAIVMYVAFVHAPPGSELLLLANTKTQSADRVFRAVKYSVENNPRLLAQCKQVLETSIKLHNGTTIGILATNAASAAGPNQILSSWTEIWGFDSEDDQRAWGEMTPPPTVPDSFRIVDTYAGYEEESELLNGLEDDLKACPLLHPGRYTVPPDYEPPAASFDEDGSLLDDWKPDRYDENGCGVYEVELPIYADPSTGLYGLWDEDAQARRTPWQRGARGERYYARQSKLRAEEFSRLHRNRRAARGGVFVNGDLWDACAADGIWWAPGDRRPVAVAIDVGTKHDHSGLVAARLGEDGYPEICVVQSWEPTKTRKDGVKVIDPQEVARALVDLRNDGLNIQVCGYDAWQFEALALELGRMGFNMWSFNQNTTRLEADTGFRNLIRDGVMRHPSDPRLTNAVASANARKIKSQNADQDRIRIVKGTGKVDLAVSASMALYLVMHPDEWRGDMARGGEIPAGFDAWAIGAQIPGIGQDATRGRGLLDEVFGMLKGSKGWGT